MRREGRSTSGFSRGFGRPALEMSRGRRLPMKSSANDSAARSAFSARHEIFKENSDFHTRSVQRLRELSSDKRRTAFACRRAHGRKRFTPGRAAVRGFVELINKGKTGLTRNRSTPKASARPNVAASPHAHRRDVAMQWNSGYNERAVLPTTSRSGGGTHSRACAPRDPRHQQDIEENDFAKRRRSNHRRRHSEGLARVSEVPSQFSSNRTSWGPAKVRAPGKTSSASCCRLPGRTTQGMPRSSAAKLVDGPRTRAARRPRNDAAQGCSTAWGLPGKWDCRKKARCARCIWVEGDSAGGSPSRARRSSRHLPLRGKSLNVEKDVRKAATSTKSWG